ncbi:hypothetical protein RD792_011505 [Penstemon davidsonii]|uniref:SWIM-type domain-containing protein n=1 Tax=Penstemon davidsonii TaxID=160366 RepID=A0ABR0D510_9LAMI|nr:hypothetical protein RD792_011505 [Penstemon davidsonii]
MSYFANKAGGYRDVGFTLKDLYNHLNKQQRCEIVDGDAEAALAYLHAKCTEDEFDESWRNFVAKFDLESSDWINDTYSIRDKWATAYLRGHFFAVMSSSQRCEGMNSFLKKHVDQAIKLHEFVRSFELAMGWLRHKEAKHDTICNNTMPVMLTQLKYLDAHAANIFTRKVFFKVREEIEKVAVLSYTHIERHEFSCTYSMFEYEKSSSCNVIINFNNQEMQCSCLQLETMGWPCSHLFDVMKSENMREIPSSCIKKRWTVEVKVEASKPYHDSIPADVREVACYGSLLQKCKEMCFYASQVDEGPQELSSFIAMQTMRKKLLYMKNKNNNGESASIMNAESVRKFNLRDPQNMKTKGDHATENGSKSGPKCSICRLQGHNKSTCKNKNANTNAQNTRMSIDDECDDASFNTFFTHDYMNSASQSPLHQNFTTNADYMSSDWHNKSTRNESQIFTFNNSVNAQNVSYDGWNIDMANKNQLSEIRRVVNSAVQSFVRDQHSQLTITDQPSLLTEKCITKGPIRVTKTIKVDGQDTVVDKDEDEMTAKEIKLKNLDKVGIFIMTKALDNERFDKVKHCKTSKEMWDKVRDMSEGNDAIKEHNLSIALEKFENFKMKSGETIDQMDSRFTKVLNNVLKLAHWRFYPVTFRTGTFGATTSTSVAILVPIEAQFKIGPKFPHMRAM